MTLNPRLVVQIGYPRDRLLAYRRYPRILLGTSMPRSDIVVLSTSYIHLSGER